MSLGTTINNNKNGILLAYIAYKIPNIHLRKLLKIIYLIDEHFMKMRGFPLTWFDFYAWAKGPVAPEVYEIINGAFNEFVTVHRSTENKRVINSAYDVRELENVITKVYSKSEILEIDKLIGTFSHRSADELSELTHMKDSLWTRVVNDNHIAFENGNTRSNVLIDLRMLFPKNDSRINIYANARWSMELQDKISSDRNPQHKIQLKVVTPSEREQYRIPVYSPAIP